MSKSSNTPRLGFKLQVVDAVEKGDMTYKQAQKFYGIQGLQPYLLG